MNETTTQETSTEVVEPTREDALTAMIAWFDAESKNLGSFNDRMELCNYAEWAARKSMGQDVGDYEGVPQLIFSRLTPEL